MEFHNKELIGKEEAILGSRFVVQTDDDQVVYRIVSSCGINLLFEVRDGQAYLIASEGSIEELEDYAFELAENFCSFNEEQKS